MTDAAKRAQHVYRQMREVAVRKPHLKAFVRRSKGTKYPLVTPAEVKK